MPQSVMPGKSPKLLYFIGVDWFFYSHFLDRAIAAKRAGFDVVVVTNVTHTRQARADLNASGIRLIPIKFERRSLNPWKLWKNIRDISAVFQQEAPDIVHQVALKPILIGSIAAKHLGLKRVISAVVGLGFAFSSNTLSARVSRWLLSGLFRHILDQDHARIVFENTDDRSFFLEKGWATKAGAVLIRGAGVDVQIFKPALLPPGPPIVMLLSRMLWDKGIAEFVDAARTLKNSGARFVLVGNPDEDNRGAIPRHTLEQWQRDGVVEWWGFRPDVETALAQATISCLPSYREGLPKSLLESIAMGLPCVATDVPGCREAVVHGVNGLLVPAKDVAALAQAIERLLFDKSLCERFGRESRRMAVEQFSTEYVNQQTLDLYDTVLRDASQDPCVRKST